MKQANCVNYLEDISPVRFPNVFRFCCGLEPSKAEEIISYLKQYAGGEKFVRLCSLEQHGSFLDACKESFIDLCSSGVTLNIDDSRLLQRSMMEIVEIASIHEIPVSELRLTNCLDFSRLYDERLFLLSGEGLSSQGVKNVKVIQLTEKFRRLDHQQIEKIMKFATKCFQLTKLKFSHCLPPWTIAMETQRTQHNITVIWISQMSKTYQLNVWGKWEVDGKELPIDDYNKEVCRFESDQTSRPHE